MILILKYMKFATGSLLLLAASVLTVGCSSEDGSETPAAVSQSEDRIETATDSPAQPQPEVQMDQSRSASAAVDPLAADDDEDPSLSANAPDLIEDLRSLDWGAAAEEDPRAEELLRLLRRQGADAFEPIRDFLLDRELSGKAPPELRQALLDVLLDLGVPEVEALAVELLAERLGAVEVWQLGQYLERVRPGSYSDAIRTAAERALIDSEAAIFLPAEFFQFLAELGNDQTALLLAALPMHLQAYGSLALAEIPDGSGIPLLAQDAREFQAGRDTAQGRLALELLAQQAPRFPEAASALLELAQQGVIPQDLWPSVLDLVAGSWVLTLTEPAAGDLVGSHTYYHPEGDQVIYRVAPVPGMDDGLESERLYLLDHLQPLAPPDLRPGPDG